MMHSSPMSDVSKSVFMENKV